MKYELVILLDKEEQLKIIKSLIENLKGKIEKIDRWGEKTLAYPIKKKKRAIFFSIFFDMKKKDTLELRKKLNFDEKILRFLLLVKN